MLNGMFLVGLGLLWPQLRLGRGGRTTAFWLVVYAAFANWAATLLSAAWAAGGAMPIAGGGQSGTPVQEAVVLALLLSLSFAMIGGCAIVLWGLRGPRGARTEPVGRESRATASTAG